MYAKRAPAIYTSEHFGKVSRFVLFADEGHLTPRTGPAAATSPGSDEAVWTGGPMMGLISIRFQLLNVDSVRVLHHPFTGRRADADGKRDQRSHAGERLQRSALTFVAKIASEASRLYPAFLRPPETCFRITTTAIRANTYSAAPQAEAT